MLYVIDEHQFEIKKDNTVKKPWFYCSMQNPFKKSYDIKHISGGKQTTVMLRIKKQYKTFEKEK